MGLINAISEWSGKREDKRMGNMRKQGVCPDCHGKGFHAPISSFYLSTSHFDCPSCYGSGSFSDWEQY